MSVRSLSAVALAAAAFGFAAPSADACDQCGYAPCPCTTPVVVAPVVVADPCCEPPRLTHRERAAARRLARLERRQDRLADRLADPCCPPAVAPAYGAPGFAAPGYGAPGYGGYEYSYSSYGYGY